jgi:hypothetical protein
MIKMTNGRPKFDELDIFGGLLGKREDCMLEEKIPVDENYKKTGGFFEQLGYVMGYAPPERKTKNNLQPDIKKFTYDYCAI